MDKNIDKKNGFWSIQTIACILAMAAIVICSSAAIMNHNALVSTNSRLEKSMKENAKLKARLAASADELEKLKREKSKLVEEKKGTAVSLKPQLVCGKAGTISRRLNNPFNIKRRYGGGKWKGEIGHDSQGHVHFISVEYGIRAAAFVLRSYYKVHKIATLEAIIDRFCGGNKEYVKFLSNRLNLKPNEKFNVLARLPELMQAMSKYESGRQLPSECLVTLDIAREL